MNSSIPIREAEAQTLYRGFERLFWGLLLVVLSSYWFKAERGEFHLFSIAQSLGEASGFLIMILGLRLLGPQHPNLTRAKWATWVWLLTTMAFTTLSFFKSFRGTPSFDLSSWCLSLFPGLAGVAFIVYWALFFLFLALLRRAALLGASWGGEAPDDGD